MSARLIGFALAGTLLAAPALAKSDVEKAADVLQFALPLGAAGLTIAHQDGDGVHQFARSTAATLSATFALKYSIDAERPKGGGGGGLSFPSGHTAAAFAGASFVARRYGWRLGLPAYAAAGFVAWSRVHTEDHHVEDVVAGALLAIASTHLFSAPLPNGLEFSPRAEGGVFGLFLRGPW